MTVLILGTLLAAGCGGPLPLGKGELHESEIGQFPATGRQAEKDRDARLEEVFHGLEEESVHVPLSAAERQNPFRSENGRLLSSSIEAGRAHYRTYCTGCHGLTGLGDGDTGTELEPPPADLNDDSVQHLSDGALHYVISNGVEGTSMGAFEGTLTVDELWNIVSYVRTFGEYRSPALVR